MKVYVKLESSQDSRSVTLDMEDLGFTKKEWMKLSEEEKKDNIQVAIDNLPDQPFWVAQDFNEED
jgi:hypothetical protein